MKILLPTPRPATRLSDQLAALASNYGCYQLHHLPSITPGSAPNDGPAGPVYLVIEIDGILAVRISPCMPEQQLGGGFMAPFQGTNFQALLVEDYDDGNAIPRVRRSHVNQEVIEACRKRFIGDLLGMPEIVNGTLLRPGISTPQHEVELGAQYPGHVLGRVVREALREESDFHVTQLHIDPFNQAWWQFWRGFGYMVLASHASGAIFAVAAVPSRPADNADYFALRAMFPADRIVDRIYVEPVSYRGTESAVQHADVATAFDGLVGILTNKLGKRIR